MRPELRHIDIKPFVDRMRTVPAERSTFGDKPQLRWIAVECLRVDPTYQRDISNLGALNVLRIARKFDWSMFTPVIVVEAEKGVYLVIDGQHRATAAALRGIKDVPCEIVVADRAKQAAAFTAINANVTRLTSQQLFHARLASGDADAAALHEACAAGGVRIMRYPVAANLMKVGDTLAAHHLAVVFKKYGRDPFVLACRCITETRQGNAGFVRGPIVEALCAVLEAEPAFGADPKQLIKTMWKFDFAAGFNDARAASGGKHSQITAAFLELVGEHLDKNMGSAAA
jgi:hypothetical protein